MKLHLPKQLFTALLAVLTLAATTPAAWGVWDAEYSDTFYYSTGDKTVNTGDSNASSDKLYLKANGLSEGELTSVTIGDNKTLVITGYWQSEDPTKNFSNLVVDSITMGTGSKMEIGGNQNLTKNAEQNITVKAIDGTLGSVLINENSNLVLDLGGTIFFTSARITGSGTLKIADGTTVDMSSSVDNGKAHIQSNIKVLGGGLLNLSGSDALGWGGTTTKSVTLLGSDADKTAKMTITGTQTMAANLTLQGNAEVSGGDLEFFNGKIEATGTNNIIKSNLYTRESGVINVVNGSDTLEIAGDVSRRSSHKALIDKQGLGTLTFSGSSNTFHAGLKVSEGVAEFKGTSTKPVMTTIQGAETTIVQGATLILQDYSTTDFTTNVNNAGLLNINGGSAGFYAGITGGGNLTQNAAGASLYLAAGDYDSHFDISAGSVKLGGTLNLKEGNIFSVNGAVGLYIDNLAGFSFSDASYVDAKGESSTHGYRSATYHLLNGGSLVLNGDITATIGTGANAYTANVNANGTVLSTTDYSNFCITEGENHTISSIQPLLREGTSHISIANGAILSYDNSNFASSMALSGDGVYVNYTGSTSLAGNVTLDSTWTGKVKITGGTKDTAWSDFSNLTNDKSGVWLEGVTGYWVQANNNNGNNSTVGWTFAGDLHLTNASVTSEGATYKLAYGANNGWGGDYRKLTGTITGDGNWGRIVNRGTNQTWEFAGDVSGWTGKLFNGSGANITTYKFTGNGDNKPMDIKVSIANRNINSEGNYVTNTHDGTLNIELRNTSGFNVHNTVEATKLTLDSTGGVTFNSNITVGTLEAQNSTSITMGGGTAQAQKHHNIGTMSAASSSVTLGNYTTLNLGGGSAAQQVIHRIGSISAGEGSKINLNANAVLERIATGCVTLEGNGIYNLGDYDITGGNVSSSSTYNAVTNVTYGAGWYGTVKFGSGSLFNFQHLDLNAFANGGNSTIELSGVTGYLQQSTNATKEYYANIRLSGNGLTINNGYGGSKYKFSGDFSGTGKFTTDKDLNGGLIFTFAGDMSGWTGELEHNQDNQHRYIYEAASDVEDTTIANRFTAAGSGESHAMNVVVNSSRDVVLSGQLLAKDSAILNISHDANGNGNRVVKSVAVEGTGTVNFEGLKITATDTASSTPQNPASMVAKSETEGSLTYLAEEASFTIADMTLTNTSIVADSGVKVKLENVSATNSMLTGGGQFALNATSTVGTAAAGETRGTLSYSAGLGVAEGSTLTLNLDVLNAVGGDQHGVYDLTITLSGFGADFAVTEAVLGMVKFDETSWLGQALEGAMFSVVTESAPEAAAAAAGGAPSVSYAAGSNVGTLVITIKGLNVPEPTTATLSLLALAALAARRRRK